jgi:hypothetical protein
MTEKLKDNKNMRMLTKKQQRIKRVSTKHTRNTKGDMLEINLFFFVEWVDVSYYG